jgi:hypothetical protein
MEPVERKATLSLRDPRLKLEAPAKKKRIAKVFAGLNPGCKEAAE